MARITKCFCDRCGKELSSDRDDIYFYDAEDHRNKVNVYNVSTNKYEYNVKHPEYKNYDLCEECYKKVENLLKDITLSTDT